MAYSLVPSPKWQKILDIEDETEQGIAATKYVCELENEVRNLQMKQEKLADDVEKYVVKSVMTKNKFFKEWLREHDRELIADEHRDWSGVQGGC